MPEEKEEEGEVRQYWYFVNIDWNKVNKNKK
jgi:hypothetical protein